MRTLSKSVATGGSWRVLHVTAIAETAAIIVKPLALYQMRVGYTVEFACARGPMIEALTSSGIACHHVSFRRKLLSIYHLVALVQMVLLMRKRRYDVVHTHTPIAAFIARIAAHLTSVPVVVYHLRGSLWDSPSRWSRAMYTLMERAVAGFTSHVFTINCIDREELIVRGIFRPERVTCLHSGGAGIDAEYFALEQIPPSERHRLRGELGLREEGLVVGYGGRIVREKGIIELLEAFEILLRSHPAAQLLIVGSSLPSDRDQSTIDIVRRYVEEHSALNSIVLAGFRSDMREMLSLVDLLVLPSYREGFGMVLAEALAMSKPVISTSTRGARELVDESMGRLVPVRESGLLAVSLLELANDPELRDRLGRAGRAAVIKRH
jgi:glycosyltransferase involved in cell wall biosynthesis